MNDDSWASPSTDLYSDAWFARAMGLAEGVTLPDVSLTVEYTCTDWPVELVHHQVFANGRLRRWAREPAAGADLCLRQTLAAHTAMLTRAGLGNRVLTGTEVVGPETGPAAPPPLDEVVIPWGAELPLVPTAPDIVVQQHLTDSAFGTTSAVFQLRQGRVSGARLGTVDNADISVVRLFADAMAERSGDLDVLDSLRSGEVRGDYLALTMFLGIYESDECRDARRALTSPAVEALVRLSTLLASGAWRSVGEGLAEATAGEMRSVP